MAECKIIEHGWEEDPAADVGLRRRARPEDFGSHGDYLDARIAHLEARLKRLSSRRSYIIVEIPFEGNGDLLDFRPPGCTGPNPQGLLSGQTIRMRFERTGPEDCAWKDVFRTEVEAIGSFLTATSEAVNGFNNQLRKI
jgi:hypothetical protein